MPVGSTKLVPLGATGRGNAQVLDSNECAMICWFDLTRSEDKHRR
jgi:hypothetical protein